MLAQSLNPYFWVDVEGPIAHHLDLGLADHAVCGDQLAIDVGHADTVVVDENEAANTGPRQCLGGPGTHTAEADDRDGARLEPGHFSGPQQELGPGECVQHNALDCV